MIVDLNNVITLQEIKQYLFPYGSDSEQAIFLFAKHDDYRFIAVGFRSLDQKDFDIQSSYHIQIKSETIGQLIKKAHDLNVCLIEIHSHVDQAKARFSWSDWYGFQDFVPHIQWRLPGRPYGALVFTQRTFDGLYWKDDFDDHKIIENVTDGKKTMKATRLSLKSESYYEK